MLERSFFAPVLLCLALAGPSQAQPTIPQTGEPAIKALVGNTLVFSAPEDMKESLWYFRPDGSMKMSRRGQTMDLFWKADGDSICIGEARDKIDSNACLAPSVSGAEVVFRPRRNPKDEGRAQILPGNPRNM